MGENFMYVTALSLLIPVYFISVISGSSKNITAPDRAPQAKILLSGEIAQHVKDKDIF